MVVVEQPMQAGLVTVHGFKQLQARRRNNGVNIYRSRILNEYQKSLVAGLRVEGLNIVSLHDVSSPKIILRTSMCLIAFVFFFLGKGCICQLFDALLY